MKTEELQYNKIVFINRKVRYAKTDSTFLNPSQNTSSVFSNSTRERQRDIFFCLFFKSWRWQHPGGQKDFKQQEAALQFYHAPQRGCHRVTIRPSVWPAELLLGMMQAQTHAKPRLCQLFEEKRVGEGDHNEYLKPFIQADLEKHRLPQRSVLLCSASPSVPFLTLGLRVCWGLQVPQRKDDETREGRHREGDQDFYRRALSKLAWPRPGPRRSCCSANGSHQQKDKRNSAIIRFKGWLQWMGKVQMKSLYIDGGAGG